MKKWMVCAIALAMMFGAGARAQGSGGGDASAPDSTKQGAAILSDTMGVDFSPYMRRLEHDIQHNWDSLIPAKAKPPTSKKGAVSIHFTILPDGKIGSMKLEKPSGDLDFDKAAWFAVTSEGQFPALPSEFHGPLLELRVSFLYNMGPAPIQGNK